MVRWSPWVFSARPLPPPSLRSQPTTLCLCPRAAGLFFLCFLAAALTLLHHTTTATPTNQEIEPHNFGAQPSFILLYGEPSTEHMHALLEVHHQNLLEHGKKHVAYRGGGPFGSIGALNGLSEVELSHADATIPIHPSRHNEYVGQIGVGTPEQLFDVILDTGSTNVWIVGHKCTVHTCTKVKRFVPEKSHTFRLPDKRLKLDVTFGTGRIRGSTAVDNVRLGPYLVANQSFGIVEDEEGPTLPHTHKNIFDILDFEGIMGLAFPEMSSTGAVPVLDNIIRSGAVDEPDFSLFIADGGKADSRHRAPGGKRTSEPPTAAMLFGGVLPSLYEPPIKFIPVIREHYWEVGLKEFWVGDTKFCCDNATKTQGLNSYVIFDSGTTFNTLPHHEIAEFLSLVAPEVPCALIDSPEGSSYYKLPTLKYVLDGDVDIVLDPKMYYLGDVKCRPAYMQIDVPSEFGHAYLLGTHAFMRHYFTVYRRHLDPNETVSEGADELRPRSKVGVARSKKTDLSELQRLAKTSSHR